MRNPNPYVEAQLSLDNARDAFIRAAAALSQPVRSDKDSVVTAILEGAYGLMKTMEADPKGVSVEKARDYLKKIRKAA